MRRNSVVVLVSLIMVIAVFGGCSETSNSDLVEFNLVIENNTSTAYDVWISNPTATFDYIWMGHVAANRSTIIHELDIGIDYQVNLTTPDAESALPPIHSRTVSSSDDDVIWEVFDPVTN